MTLIDVMVAGGSMLLLMVVIVGLLVDAKLLYQSSVERASNLGTLEGVFGRFERDTRGLTGYDIPGGQATHCALHSALDSAGEIVTDSDGNGIEQKLIVWYYNSPDQTVRRREFAAGTAVDYTAMSDGTGMIVADHVVLGTQTNGFYIAPPLSGEVLLAARIENRDVNGRLDQQNGFRNVCLYKY